jgi:hypothetical protein
VRRGTCLCPTPAITFPTSSSPPRVLLLHTCNNNATACLSRFNNSLLNGDASAGSSAPILLFGFGTSHTGFEPDDPSAAFKTTAHNPTFECSNLSNGASEKRVRNRTSPTISEHFLLVAFAAVSGSHDAVTYGCCVPNVCTTARLRALCT